MKKIVAGVVMVVIAAVVSGCSGISVIKPVEPKSKLAIVQFKDCDRTFLSNCSGSGKKMTDTYAKVLGVPVVPKDEASKFDAILTGYVTEYYEAVPVVGGDHMAGVELRVEDRNGLLLVTQVKTKKASNLFGSASGISTDLAESLKSALNR